MCSLGAKCNLGEARRLYGQGAFIEAPFRNINICILVLPAQKKQYVVFTGTKWDNAMTLKHDLASCSPGEISKHYELHTIAKTHAENAKRFLKKDFPLFLVGHSVGGTVALLAAPIFVQMKYRLDSVTTFGQPAVLLTSEMEAFKKIKVIRVRIHNDPIPLLFQGCRHIGLELVLIGHEQFTYSKTGLALPAYMYPEISGPDLAEERLSYHHVDYYCRALYQRCSEAKGIILGDTPPDSLR